MIPSAPFGLGGRGPTDPENISGRARALGPMNPANRAVSLGLALFGPALVGPLAGAARLANRFGLPQVSATPVAPQVGTAAFDSTVAAGRAAGRGRGAGQPSGSRGGRRGGHGGGGVATPGPGFAGPGPGYGGFSGPGGESGQGGGGGGPGGSSGADSQGGGMGCFVAGTPVLMADGHTKPIEAIEPGDKVICFEDVVDHVAPLDVGAVVAAHRYSERSVVMVNGLQVTPEHRFLVEKNRALEWREAQDLDRNVVLIGDAGHLAIVSDDAGCSAGVAPVFNITVEPHPTFIAGGLRVHNIKHGGGMVSEATVPGVLGAAVPETLLEGEYVMNPAATQLLGPALLEGVNRMASGRPESDDAYQRFGPMNEAQRRALLSLLLAGR